MRLLYLLLSNLVVLCCLAQKKDSTDLTKMDRQFIIEKNLNIEIPSAEKLDVNRPSHISNIEKDSLKLIFVVNKPDFNWPTTESHQPFHYPNILRNSYSQNYLKIGFGNFISPQIDAGYFINFDSLTVVRGGFTYLGYYGDNARNSTSLGFRIASEYHTSKILLLPKLIFDTKSFNFYGNTRNQTDFFTKDPSSGNYSIFSFLTGIKKKSIGYLDFLITPALKNTSHNEFKNSKKNNEFSFLLDLKSSYMIDSAFIVGLDFDINASNYASDTLRYQKSLINLNPWANYKTGNFSIYGGLNIGFNKEYSTENSYLFPMIKANWSFIKNWDLFINFTGRYHWKDLHELVLKNSFFDGNLNILNEKLTSSLRIGVEGKLFEKIYLLGAIHFDKVKDQMFFVPSINDSSKYSIIYDDSGVLSKTTLVIDANYTLNTNFIIGLNILLNTYSLAQFDRPWHLPTNESKIYLNWKLYKKWLVTIDWTLKSGLWSPTYNSNFVKLNNIIDGNFSIQYNFKEKMSISVDVNNILNKEYQSYFGYPVRGINMNIGFKYRF